MIINLKLVLIRINLLSIIIFILCKIGTNIRKKYKLLKFYDYKTKQLTIDKLNELNNIEQLKKDILKNESLYNTKKNFIKSLVNSYETEQNICKNHKLILFHKLNNLSNTINTNLINNLNVIDDKYNYMIKDGLTKTQQETHLDEFSMSNLEESKDKETFNDENETISKDDQQTGGLNNENCVFPEFENYEKDNKCCPEFFSNSITFSNNKRCATDNIQQNNKNFDNPIKTCKEAGGYVSKITDSIYICNSYLKNLKGGDGWIQLGNWRLGYTKHHNLEDNNFYFTLCNSIQKNNIFIIDNYYNFNDDLTLNQDALYVLQLLDNIDNINVGNGYIEFSEKWRLGYYDDSKLLLSAKSNNKSYCWHSNGSREIINYTLWNKDNKSSNIYFDANQEVLRFGNYWYIGQYDDKYFSISNKLSEITNITYTYKELPKYIFKDVIQYENCVEKVNLGEAEINRLFKKSNIFRFKNHNETIFYHRKTYIPDSLSIYELMIRSFNNVNNELNKDFKLYNNLQDLHNDTNSWSKCNYKIYTEKIYDNPIIAMINEDKNLMNSIKYNCDVEEFKETLKLGEGYYFNSMDGNLHQLRENVNPNTYNGHYKNEAICRVIPLQNINEIRELYKAENYKQDDWTLTSLEDKDKIGVPQTFLPKEDKNIGFPANCGKDNEVFNRWARGLGSCSQSKNFTFSIVFPQNINALNSYTGKDAEKYSLSNKNVFPEFYQIDALTPIIEDIHLEDIDTELKVQINNNCPFPQLEDNCPVGKDCLYQKCCPLGFNNTQYNSNYKQCSSANIDDTLQLNCESAGGRITENVVQIKNPNFLQKQKKLIYNCVNKSIEDKYSNIKYYALIIILILSTVYAYIKL